MIGVRCYNLACGDDGRCALEDYCPVMTEEYEYQRRMYYADRSPPEGSEEYRQQMVDAGRGHLVRE
jgi:hypothetical protein